MEREAAAARRPFDRYTDPRMRVFDRNVGNLFEWSPVFLGLFWVRRALVCAEQCVRCASAVRPLCVCCASAACGRALRLRCARARLPVPPASGAVLQTPTATPNNNTPPHCRHTATSLQLATLLGADTARLGWGYVACRVLWSALALSGAGISRTAGAKTPILLSTAPGYVILLLLGREVFSRALA